MDADVSIGDLIRTAERGDPAAAVLNVDRQKQPIPAREADAMVQRLYRAWGKRAAS